MGKWTIIMDENAMQRAITRISHEILERNKGVESLAIIGIQRRGVPLAKAIAEKIHEIEKQRIPTGYLDITFYRDDLSMLAEHPVLNATKIDFTIDKQNIILVDDVLYTGRTVRAAIEAIMDIGRPASIQLAIIIDRGHRELPIRADYVGKNVPTAKSEIVHVMVTEFDGINQVVLADKKPEEK